MHLSSVSPLCLALCVSACGGSSQTNPPPSTADMAPMGRPTFGELGKVAVSRIPQAHIPLEINDPARMYYFTVTPRGLAVGDMDGDGFADIVFAPNLYNARPELP